MAKVAMFDKRPACRICGSKSHVTTVANLRSPMRGCCASCGVVLRELQGWLKGHSAAELNLLMSAALNTCSETLQVGRPLQRQA